MNHRLPRLAILTLLALTLPLLSQTPRSTPSGPKIIIKELGIEGTSTIDTAQLNDIRDSLLELRMTDDTKELAQRLRNAFQERGYFDVDVASVNIKALDPLARPKPVKVQATVSDGPRFLLGNIIFAGYRSLPPERLREAFPLPIGEFFSSAKVRSGLEKLLELYNASGYLDFSAVPSVNKSGEASISLTIQVHEGPQYHFKEFKTHGDPELGSRLLSRWQLEPGAVFDAFYVQKFLDENSSLLPSNFAKSRDLNIAQNCRDAIVSVEMNLDPQKPYTPTPNVTNCDEKKEEGQ
jgi:outer membrane protein assembly factor BamA